MQISVVTPNHNGARYLAAAMDSVINQRDVDVDYVLVDGGSRDASLDIIRAREHQLSSWLSEPDQGMYDALNKGFALTSGEIMAWLNSDDMYTPWAFSVVADIFETFPELEWLTTLCPLYWDEHGRAARCGVQRAFDAKAFFRGENLPGVGASATGWIQQESTFWRRSLWERAGGRLNDALRLAGDFDLWARFFEHAELVGVRTPLGGFRVHPTQATKTRLSEYLAEATSVLEGHGWSRKRAEKRTRLPKRRRVGPAFERLFGPPRPICEYDLQSRLWVKKAVR